MSSKVSIVLEHAGKGRTVQLMTVEMLSTGITLPAALMAANKLLVCVDLASALALLRGGIDSRLHRAHVEDLGLALFQSGHGCDDAGHIVSGIVRQSNEGHD